MTLVNVSGRWPLVGRDEFLADFQRLLADPSCSGVVIHGAAGVGKSRLAAECAEIAERAGWRIGRAVATEAASSLPLGAIAHLLPVGVDFSDPTAGFTAVAGLLREDGQRPVLLIDDLPLLDAASGLLLLDLVQTETIFLIGTARHGQKLNDAVRDLLSADAIHRTDLNELTIEQVSELLQRTLGGPVARQAAHEFHSASDGNPLFLREMVLGALASGDLENDGEVWDLRPSELLGRGPVGTQHLSELISTRLTATAPQGRLLLEALAVCGELSLSGALTIASTDDLADLEAAGLVRRHTDQRRTSISLVHPLYSEILRARVPYLRRRGILLAQAELIEKHGSRRNSDVLRTASWKLAAGAPVDPDLLIQAASLARHAHDYGKVVSVLDALPPHRHTLTTRLMLGEALREAGRSADAETVLLEAAASANNDHEKLVIVVARSLNLFLVQARTDKALAVIRQAYPDLPDPVMQRALNVLKGYIFAISGRLTEALHLLEDLEDDIADAANPSLWVIGTTIRGGALAMSGRPQDGKAISQKGYEAHKGIPRATHPAFSLIPMIVSLSENGELDEARKVGEQAFSELVSARAPLPRVWIAYHMGRVEWLAGDVASARRWYAESVALARSQRQMMALQPALAGLAAAAAQLGDIPAAEKALTESLEHPHMGVFAGEERLAEAWIKAATGSLTSACEILFEAADAAAATGYVTSQIMVLTDAARLGSARQAAPLLGELAQQCQGPFVQDRAQLAAALAADDAASLLEVAEHFHEYGAHLLAAEAATAAATAWRRKGRPHKVNAAVQAAARSRTYCPDVSTPLLRTAAVDTPLTNREHEIALLAASGMSSKEIADQLLLSARTVDNHLQRVFSKLGVTSRRELGINLAISTPPTAHDN
ncbi:LuxR C-terminal-related transcriptional regulator [Streptomyces sp. NPDC004787]|uniref:LuxR C-terminal-related transcriptional regulator n=1 Tax=Streptomyces sp. NPDC004787 TaxID=3154291 RepID=UPI0033BF2DB5